jgi:shikimate dehydrogenase
MLGGSTRLVALLGHPVAHSLSPRMQNAAFAARGLDWAYVALDVVAEDLETAVRGLVASGFAGANVTIPHSPTRRAPAQARSRGAVRRGRR